MGLDRFEQPALGTGLETGEGRPSGLGRPEGPASPRGVGMRFVCLNLDIEEASLLRRTLAGSLGRAGSDRASADDRALHAMIGELDRLLETGPRRRVAVAPVVAESLPTGPRLEVMRGGLLD